MRPQQRTEVPLELLQQKECCRSVYFGEEPPWRREAWRGLPHADVGIRRYAAGVVVPHGSLVYQRGLLHHCLPPWEVPFLLHWMGLRKTSSWKGQEEIAERPSWKKKKKRVVKRAVFPFLLHLLEKKNDDGCRVTSLRLEWLWEPLLEEAPLKKGGWQWPSLPGLAAGSSRLLLPSPPRCGYDADDERVMMVPSSKVVVVGPHVPSRSLPRKLAAR